MGLSNLFKASNNLLGGLFGDPVLLRHVARAYNPATSAEVETTTDELVVVSITDTVVELANGDTVYTGTQTARIINPAQPPVIGDKIYGTADGTGVSFEITKQPRSLTINGVNLVYDAEISGPKQ